MLIRFERSGGFAGMRKAITLDTGSLSQEEAGKFDELVKTADFFNLPEKFPVPKRGADHFQYRLTVEMEGKKHTVDVGEPAVTEALRPLVQFLSKYPGKK
jgi:hypothetical protein